MSETIVDHEDALLLAAMKQKESNLARCYLALRATHDAAIRERDELRAAFDIESARIEKIAAYVGAADYIDSIGPVLGAIDAAIRAAEERAYRRAADKARDKILDRGRKSGDAHCADTAQAVHAAVVALIGGDR